MMGSTWRTTHYRDFMLVAVDVYLILQKQLVHRLLDSYCDSNSCTYYRVAAHT